MYSVGARVLNYLQKSAGLIELHLARRDCTFWPLHPPPLYSNHRVPGVTLPEAHNVFRLLLQLTVIAILTY